MGKGGGAGGVVENATLLENGEPQTEQISLVSEVGVVVGGVSYKLFIIAGSAFTRTFTVGFTGRRCAATCSPTHFWGRSFVEPT